jgi:hypothetical protein
MGNHCAKVLEETCMPANPPLLLRWSDEHPSLYTTQPDPPCYLTGANQPQRRPREILESSPKQPTMTSFLHARPFLSFIDEESEAENFYRYYQTKTGRESQRRSVRSREASPARPTVASFVRRRPQVL